MKYKNEIDNSLTLCMLVKNEADLIGKALESVRHLVSEIVVVDTGSTDGTQKIATDLGAVVHDVKWEDDFSKMRNVSLSFAKTKWILVMDADEMLDSQGCHAIRQWILQTDEQSAKLLKTTYSNDHYRIGWKPNNLRSPHLSVYQGYVEEWSTRVFLNQPKICFHKRINEELMIDGQKPQGEHRMSQVRIHHFGRVKEKARDENTKLYLKLAQLRLKDHPLDTDARFDYAYSLWESNNESQALQEFEKVLTALPVHMSALIAAARIYKNQKKLTRAKGLLEEALRLSPNQLQALQLLGETYMLMEDYPAALSQLRKARNVGLESAELLTRLGEVYFRIGKHTEARQFLTAAINQNSKYPHAWLGMGIVLHQLGHESEGKNYTQKGMQLLSCSNADMPNADLNFQNAGIYDSEGKVI